MRRQISFLVAATTSAVIIAFLIPLALFSRSRAEERALDQAKLQTSNLVFTVLSKTPADLSLPTIPADITARTGDLPAGHTTLYLPDGRAVPNEPIDQQISEARRTGLSTEAPEGDGAVVVRTIIGTSGTTVIRTRVSRDLYHEGVAETTALLAGLGMILLLGAMFAADRLGRRISDPVQALALAAQQMRDGHLDTRVPATGTSETVALASALNQLATRVEQLLASERDAVADLSHRLRTPVTALRLDTDGITDPETAERLRQHVAQLERTVDAIVHDARRPTRAGGTSCDVGKVVAERVGFWSALAEEQGRSLKLAIPEDRQLRAGLDASDLSDVVDVLIDNVFAHTPEGLPLEVWVAPRADGAVVLTVEDGGEGLPQEDIIARGSSGAGSTGLGMDIVRRAAIASGGTMEVGRSRLGGALIRVILGPPQN